MVQVRLNTKTSMSFQDKFIQGLADPEIQEHILGEVKKDLSEAVKIAGQ